MSMGKRYTGGFYSVANTLYRVEIWQEGYSGAAANVAFGESPVTIEWAFTDAPTWHLRIDGPTRTALPGPAADPDLRLRVGLRDWVDVVAGRTDARRLLVTRRMRPSGSLRLLARLPRIFPG